MSSYLFYRCRDGCRLFHSPGCSTNAHQRCSNRRKAVSCCFGTEHEALERIMLRCEYCIGAWSLSMMLVCAGVYIYMYLSSRAATYESRESCWIDSVRRACFETGTVKSRRGELVCRKLGASGCCKRDRLQSFMGHQNVLVDLFRRQVRSRLRA